MKPVKIELKKFDPSVIKNDAIITLIGKRGSGKSVCMKDILSYQKDIPVGVVISPTEQANNFFEKFVPKMLIYDEYEPPIIQKFLDRQINITKQKNEQQKRNGTTDIDNRAFLILDDCLYDKTWVTDKNIRCIFLNGRHYKIFFLITMQHSLGLPPLLRNNVDYIFIFRNNILKERQKIFEHYAGMFPNFEVFCAVMDQCTENFECLVIDNRVQSNKLEDQVKWYKAKESNFKMCSTELWDLCALEDERRNTTNIFEDEENDEPYTPDIFLKNRNKIKINIKKKPAY